ncbi:SLATT domain-containing protein [Lysinibacillus sp. FSL L8-0312]|uniref:SLATT domain-containing protein n=1 Tax=Lysinibacillus sp. FSL L8-0312 TaxID=2921521 RepID=UPI0030F52D06
MLKNLWDLYRKTVNKNSGTEIDTTTNENTAVPANKNKINEEIEKFRDNRVWTTKKVRMIAEERMNRNNLNSIILVNYYTFFILCYSIIGLKYGSSDILSIASVIISIGLFGVSLFVSLYGYREKALAYKQSHLELDKIESKLGILILDEGIEHNDLLKTFDKYKMEYNEVISKTENHSNLDFLKFKVNSNNSSKKEKFNYYFLYKIPLILFMIVVYACPIIGIILIFMNMSGAENEITG